MKRLLILSLLFVGATTSFAQKIPDISFRSLNGRIMLANNKPCSCTVLLYGTGRGTYTDSAGNFKWNSPNLPFLFTIYNRLTDQKYTVHVGSEDEFLNIKLDKKTELASKKVEEEWKKGGPSNEDLVSYAYQSPQFYKFIGKPMPGRGDPTAEVPIGPVKPGANDTTVHNSVEVMPNYVGGTAAWVKYLTDNVKANPGNPQGKVFIQFIVEKDGSLSHFRILRGLCDECDKEVLRVVRASPRWTPAMTGGIPVRCYYNVPVIYGNKE